MLVRRKSIIRCLSFILFLLPALAISIPTPKEQTIPETLTKDAIAKQLGWVKSDKNNCGGFYLDQAFTYPMPVDKENYVGITSNQGLYSQYGTSHLEGKVTLTRAGQQITANKAYLYRDPQTGKLSAIDMHGDVHLREPNTLIIGKQAHYNFISKSKSLLNTLYRTALAGKHIIGPKVSRIEREKPREITALTAWGEAQELSQTEPLIYNLENTTFTTCPPDTTPAWMVRAKHITLNKITGRGYTTHARLLVKNIPVFYLPYLDFSIDKQRKSGFLWPSIGGSSQWGPYFLAPFYWNLAPNG